MKPIFLLLLIFACFLESKSQQVSFNEIFELYPHRADTSYLIKFFKSKAISPWHYEDSSFKAWWQLKPSDDIFSENLSFGFKQATKNFVDFRTKSIDVYNSWLNQAQEKGFNYTSTQAIDDKQYDLYFSDSFMLVVQKGDRYNFTLSKSEE